MTNRTLSQDYFFRAKIRVKALNTLYRARGYADVVRESQEIVELVLKAVLRQIAIEPPHWHDVGSILIENKHKLPTSFVKKLPKITKISKELRRERELAFYGDDDYIPSNEYTSKQAKERITQVAWLIKTVSPLFV